MGRGVAEKPWRPSKEQLAAAEGARVPDVIGPGLRVLFCGINPGLYSGAVGHHFARPGNRFWRTLYLAGFTERMLSPFEERTLLDHRLGITNLVERSTARADQLHPDELRNGAVRLRRKACRTDPAIVVVLGLSAFRVAFGEAGAEVGPQPETICRSRAWLLPNPSGLNAHYQLDALATEFGRLRDAI